MTSAAATSSSVAVSGLVYVKLASGAAASSVALCSSFAGTKTNMFIASSFAKRE